ncbi:MAG TPA: toxin, partial [Limnochordia bacterium]|nr:toxin [Limnochordia bacterium]
MAIKSARYGGFSESAAKESLWGTVVYKQETQYTYDFANYFHPYVSELLQQLNRKSIDGLLDLDFLEGLHAAFFDAIYAPNESDRRVVVDSHEKSIDVGHDGLRGPYAIYNWELLFHVPLIIAVHLSKNQRFAEAQKWFHYIFDPTSDDGRFWRFLAFADAGDPTDVAAAMRLLSKPDDECTDTELALKQSLLNGYEAVREDPFQPHKVARTRLIAYQYSVVMKYLDNLIAWGDSLFRQDTMESTAEATQIYVLAANLLGPRPERVPPRGVVKAKSFAQLKAAGLDVLGNSLVELEGQFPFNLYEPAADETGTGNPLFGIGRTLYFCIPRNDKLLGYWDTVADRLFKLRHCLNIEGVFRQLPLFQPPLDPGMLVKAAAAGLDISSLVSGLNQPLAPVRCRILIQKAIELAGEVRGMGQALLSAMEKKDAESLARLRQKHEIAIQKLAQDVAFLQWKDAEATTDALAQSRDAAVERYLYYKRLLGIDTANPPDEIKDAVAFTLDRSAQLTEESFDEVYAGLVGQYVHDAPLESFPALDVIDEGNLYLNKHEDEELNVEMPVAFGLKIAAEATDVATAALYFIPSFKIDLHYWGIGGDTKVAGGEFLGHAGEVVAKGLRMGAEIAEHLGAEAAKQAGYQRRAEDWKLQANLAAHELVVIGRQLIGSLIKEQVARHEHERVKVQIAQAEEVDQFLHDKFTNAELYTWMQGELAKVYYEHYKFAFDVARKAEQTMKFELMRPELDQLSFVKFN